MATRNAILQAFGILSGAGVKGGPSTPNQRRITVSAFEACLADLTDSELEAAVFAYLRDPAVCQWWPQPGILLVRAPGRRVDEIDDGDEAWGEVLAWVQGAAMSILHPNTYEGAPPAPVPPWDAPEAGSRGAAIAGALRAVGGAKAILALGSRGSRGDGLMAMRASFRNCYGTMAKRHRLEAEDASVLELVGRTAKQLGMDR
jgi:hypothetical protein